MSGPLRSVPRQVCTQLESHEKSLIVVRFPCPSLVITGSLKMDSSTDRESLLGLYRATGGLKWYRAYEWNTSPDITSWYGVKGSRGRVVELILSSNNLQGDALMPLYIVCLMKIWRLTVRSGVQKPLLKTLCRMF